MKQFLLLLFFVFSLLQGYGSIVSKERAITVASNFLYGSEHAVKSFSSYKGENGKSVYVVNFSPEGWVLVADHDNVRPVLGYSHTGFFDAQNVRLNVQDWLDYQTKLIEVTPVNTNFKDEWEILEKQGLPELKSVAAVDPLLDTKWDQDAGWNRFCPTYDEGPDGKAYVGCVAVAMAQALFHLKYPERPTGKKSYLLEPYGTISLDFDQEPAYNWSGMSLSSPDDDNSRLLYNCAVAVEMDFGGDGSGAYTTRVPFAFQKYFGFNSSVRTISRYSDNAEWVALLKSELNKGNVLIYSGDPGTGAAGHAFNIDGYTSSGYFHFNWGWSGSYNGNFSINDVAPGSNDFTNNQKVVVGIAEPYWGPTDIILSNQKIKENMPVGTVVGNISIEDNSENDSFTIEVFGAPLFMQEGYAEAKFYEENMQLKSLEPLIAGAYPEVTTLRVTDGDGNQFEKQFNITVDKVTSVNIQETSGLKIYPNPARNIVNISNSKGLKSFRLSNNTGSIIMSSIIYNSEVGIEVEHLPNGVYILEVIDTNNKKYSRKIVIQK